MRNSLLFLIVVFFTLHVVAQDSKLYIPLNVQKAYKTNTRSYDGRPGNNYWQNKSQYKINAEILPDSSCLIGNETITYFNNSPDTLKFIVIRFYQDILKKGAVRDWYINPETLTDGVKINYLQVEGDSIDVSPSNKMVIRSSTNMIVKLNDYLAPKNKLKITIGWEFSIHETLKLRMGNYGNGNMFISYWYPQISVYDDIDKWDRLDYQGMVEFYNDFSDFDVKIKLPKEFLVWATGELQNAQEILRDDIIKKYELAKSSDETIKIVTQDDYKKGNITKSSNNNTWKFTADKASDFSFALSKTYNWDGASVEVDSKTKRRVLTDVVYPDSTIHWDEGAQFARASIDYLSHELPGYPYPYSHATSFCNGSLGGGMETPMMANNGAPKSKASLVGLIFHELTHSYFPFYMGTNERKYAWMDEGWASFFPREVVDRIVPTFDYWKRRSITYSKNAGKENELPPIVPSFSYKGRFIRTGFYNRPANAYRELEFLLGRDLFKQALLEYMDRWNEKHPIPQDFFFTFNDVVGEDLTWFWNPWFYEFGYPDLAISNAMQKDKNISVEIKKLGNIPTRVLVTLEFEDGTKETIEKSARVWKDGKDNLTLKLEKSKKVKRVEVGNIYIPDSVKENNIFEF